MRRLISAALPIVALAACSSADLNTGPSSPESAPTAGHPAPASVQGPRPLTGSCTTVVTRLAPPPIEVQRIEYTCRLAHLGLTHAVVTQTVDVATGTLSSTGVYTAANGDELSASFTGTAVLSFTDPADATVTFEGTQVFSAGTGRFADASGTAHLAGSARINLITGSGTGEFTLHGTLTY
ncbi:MAG TPA: hypothetical protein VFZ26_19225 [Gemmatimonadales bacterium]